MSEATLIALRLLAELEPSVIAVLTVLLGRWRDQLNANTDQAIFTRVAAQAIIAIATDDLFTSSEKRAIARSTIVNTMDTLAVPAPPLDVIDAFIADALP